MESLDNVPRGWQVTTIEANPSRPLPDLRKATEAALAAPLDCGPLRQSIRRSARICIVFTDSTRACPDHILVPALLHELDVLGIPQKNITLLCATGMHRPSTLKEKMIKLTVEVPLLYDVQDHQAQNPDVLTNLGTVGRPNFAFPIDVPVFVNRLASEADILIATGVVEPHQYAGYSGGSKTIVAGCGGETTISATHGPAFLDDPRVRLGQVDGNPFQIAMRAGAKRAGLRFIVNVVLDGQRRAVAVQAGFPDSVHDQLVEIARMLYEVPVTRQYDVVVAGIGGPQDINLYQASRAPTYIGLAAKPVVREGGVIITPARCTEGAGEGQDEQRFFETLVQASDLAQLLADLRKRGTQAGEQRAYMVAQVLLKQTVIIVGSECPDAVHACKMIPAKTMQEAMALAKSIVGDTASVLNVPHTLQTLPVIT